jgi:hypothetical protein
MRQARKICECGTITGVRCEAPEGGARVLVEWMPEALRESHRAGGNAGCWPHNGAERLRVHPACAEWILRDSWASLAEES